jgi:hypothetical protein
MTIASVTFAMMADKDDPVNKVNGQISGQAEAYVRSRPDQYATVACSELGGALFVSKSMGNVWRLAKAKPGNALGSGAGENPSHWIMPT